MIIVGPPGSFTNHLRWLLLLDKKFTSIDNQWNIFWSLETFSNIRGVDWPTEYQHFSKMPDWVKRECYQWLIPDHFIDDSIETKFQYIINEIYPNERSWHNWLIPYEWTIRPTLDQYILLDHNPKIAADKLSIAIIGDPDFLYKRYQKFKGAYTLNEFNLEFDRYNEFVSNNANKFTLIVQAEDLYNRNLNRILYNKSCETFGLEDNYLYAKNIHKQWYNLQVKAEIEYNKNNLPLKLNTTE